jgi:type VI secretion system protein ImpL
VSNSARDAYVRELDGVLLPQVAGRVRERLITYRTEPEKLHEYLKAYLMLGEPQRLDKEHVAYVAEVEFGTGDDRENAPASLATHFTNLVEQSNTLRPIPIDAALVAQARATIRQASVPRLIYSQLQRKYAEDTARAVRLDVATGVGGDQVIRRRSGASLTDPVPALYGRTVFNEITGVQSLQLVKEFASDSWVWAESGSSSNPVQLASEVIEIYERDYANTWNGILSDLELVPFATLQQASRSLEVLSSPASPLRGLVAVVVDNTRLVAAPAKTPATGIGATGQKITEGVGKILKPLKQAAGASTITPGTLITAQFQPVHRLVEGEPGNTPLDRIIAQLAQIHLQLQALAPGFGNNVDPKTVLSNPALREQLLTLRQEAIALPPVLQTLVSQVGRAAEVGVMSGVASGLARQFREEVIAECNQIVNGRYPFVENSPVEVPLSDFARLFAPGGIFDAFFRDNLRPLVDTSRQPWAWLPGTVGVSDAMLRKTEEAMRIRQIFFSSGATTPGLRLDVMMGPFDPSVQRFVIDIEGQQIESGMQQRQWSIIWPGKAAQFVHVLFQQRFGGRVTDQWDGPWALFRMMDESTVQRESDVRSVVTVRAGNMQGQLIVDATSIRNPFANREWRQFRCEP